MISAIFLVTPGMIGRAQLEEAPEVLDREGVRFSLRGGPRQPKPTDHVWGYIAVYAPDELTEEEFQDLYETSRPHVPEFNLHY